MSEFKESIQRHRPKPGKVDNLEVLKKDKIDFRTIIGSMTGLDARSSKEIPCTPGLGLYYWEFKATDPQDEQKPHFQDEVYVILEGEGTFELESEVAPIPIKSGDILFVPALMPHRFLSNKKDSIRMLILFGPDWCGRDATAEQEKIPK